MDSISQSSEMCTINVGLSFFCPTCNFRYVGIGIMRRKSQLGQSPVAQLVTSGQKQRPVTSSGQKPKLKINLAEIQP